MGVRVDDILIDLPTTFTGGTPIDHNDIEALEIERKPPGGPDFLLLDNNRAPTDLRLNLVTDYGETIEGVYAVRARVRMKAAAGGKVSANSNEVNRLVEADNVPNPPLLRDDE